MIWSVSTLLRRSGTAVPACTVNLSMFVSLQISGAGQRAAHGSGGGDERRHEMRAAALALPSFEVAVGRRCAALTRRELVGVHAETHRAARLAPLAAGGGEHLVQALLLG